jgi:hypothetical protein
MPLLDKLVGIYRELSRPALDSSSNFRVDDIQLTQSLISKIETVWSDPHYSELNIEVVINYKRFNGSEFIDLLTEHISGPPVTINASLPRQGNVQFYSNTLDFISRNASLSAGIMPDDFYISDINYLPNRIDGNVKPIEIKKLEHFCLLIKYLKKVSHFVSHKNNMNKAIFMVTDEDNKETSPRSIDLKFTKSLMELDFINLSILEELVDLADTATHKFEKLSIFRLSLWEILAYARLEDADIHFIGTHWEELLNTYNKSYALYIRGFSFTKFKSEIEEFQHESIEKINDLLGNIIIKSLAVPSLFSIWLFVLRSPKYDAIFNSGVCLALLFSATVIIFAIDNQQYLIGQVRKSIKRSISNFLTQPSLKFPIDRKSNDELDDLIHDNNKQLQGRLNNISLKLLIIRLSIWFFVLLSSHLTFVAGWEYRIPMELIYIIVINLVILTWVIQSFDWKLNLPNNKTYLKPPF